jgi:type II restriction enzyme
VSTGELIVPLARRIGILDRKLRIVNENTETYDDWLKWTFRAFEASYGYEYQGDNVLIARSNLLLTFVDYYEERWERKPDGRLLTQLANKIAWNIWQMDGLKDTVPLGKPYEEFKQITLFEMFGLANEGDDMPAAMPCRIFNWRSNASLKFMQIKEKSTMGKKLFDYVIGNPPYQEQVSDADNNSSLSKQLFPIFIRESTTVADKVMLITPSRWFTGDAQDKSFLKLREFIRNNNHVKYLCNYPDAREVFPNAEIKGGVSYFIFDSSYEGMVQFDISQHGNITSEIRNLFEDGLDVIISDGTTYSILSKVIYSNGFKTITEITRGRNAFGIIGKEDVLNAKSRKDYFDGAIMLFCKAGEIRWTERLEITKGKDIVDRYKVFISKSAGSPGKDLKIIGTPYVGERGSACTDSLFPIGNFDTFDEADNLRKYIQTQFLRFMVSVMKISQNVTQLVYKFVPLQDFTASSDIDWSKSIHEIDLQLYRKYGLSEEEIAFIESHVKEMV